MNDSEAVIRLRRFNDSDAETVARWMRSSHLPESLPGLNHDYFRSAENWKEIAAANDGTQLFLIVLAGTGKPIGLSVLYQVNRTEGTGYTGTAIFEREHLEKGMGFASKLLQLKYAFSELGLKKVYSKVVLGDHRLTEGLTTLGYRLLSREAAQEIAGGPDGHEIFELSRAGWESASSISAG